MGAVKRLVLIVALATLAGPAVAHAGTTTYGPSSFTLGPTSTGDGFNNVNADAASGRVTVIRYNAVPINGGLGCGGSGGFGFLKVSHTAISAIQSVTASFTEALVDPYTFMKLRVRAADGYLAAQDVPGPTVADGTISVNLAALGATGPVTVEFGFEVTSACPNVDGGTARFTSIAIVEA